MHRIKLVINVFPKKRTKLFQLSFLPYNLLLGFFVHLISSFQLQSMVIISKIKLNNSCGPQGDWRKAVIFCVDAKAVCYFIKNLFFQTENLFFPN